MTRTHGAAVPQTLRFQRAANWIVRGILRTPVLCRLAGRRLVTVYVIGRRSGTQYAVPTAYVRDGSAVLIGTSFRWARNLRTGEPVDIRLMGERRTADVEVVTDEDGVLACYRTIVRANRQFAKFNHIAIDAAGDPDAADLRRAWASGARAIRCIPR